MRRVLLGSARSFLLGEVAHRFRLERACRRFWAKYPPQAVRFWTQSLPPAVIAFRALPAGCRPLIFWHPGALYQVREPYVENLVPADVVFAVSEAHRELLLSRGFLPGQIVIAGAAWLGTVRHFQAVHAKGDSRRELGIGAVELCVLCDAAKIMRGYMAAAEQTLILQVLLEFARTHPSFHLIVKAHPSHQVGPLEALLEKYPIPNLTVIPPTMLPYHALNAADLLVTKFSALALEAMVLGVPSIGVLFDGEREFACYEDAVDYVTKPAELQGRLESLHDDVGRRRAWTETLRAKADDFLCRHCSTLVDDPHEVVAQEIVRRIAAPQPVVGGKSSAPGVDLNNHDPRSEIAPESSTGHQAG